MFLIKLVAKQMRAGKSQFNRETEPKIASALI